MSSDAVEGDLNQTDARREWQSRHVGPQAREVLERDADVYIHQSLSTPCLDGLASASGSWLFDVDGKRFLDLHGNSAHQVGHGHPRVIEAVTKQMARLPFCPRRFTCEPAIELAEALGARTQGQLPKVLLAPGGSAAVGIALKLARVATGRAGIIGLWDSFHGASMDAISVGGEEPFKRHLGPLLPGVEHVPSCDPPRCPFACGSRCSGACLDLLLWTIEKTSDLAAVVAEPLRCTTVAVPPADYWPRVHAACRRVGALLIFDEIPLALGRTGRFFAYEHFGVVPDILVLGKGLGGAVFPQAAVLARKDLDCAGDVALGHYTHEKSPVGAAAALATMAVLDEEGLVERATWIGDRLAQSLEGHPGVREVRRIGALVGVELDSAERAERVLYSALSQGVSFKVSAGTVLTLAPPLTISDDELRFGTRGLAEALDQADGEAL